MKRIILSTILFAFALTAVSAQMLSLADSTLEITAVPADGEQGLYIEMTNMTTNTLDLRWERTIVSAPDAWDSWVCTVPGLCGLPGTNLLNFEMGAGEVGEFQYHVEPNETGGLGEVNIKLINNANNVTLIDVAISIDFGTVSANEIEEAQIKMFPNPASDHFQLINNQIVDQVIVYNILGKQVKTFGPNVQSYFVGDLPKGIYLVQLNDVDSNSTKTMKLKKS